MKLKKKGSEETKMRPRTLSLKRGGKGKKLGDEDMLAGPPFILRDAVQSQRAWPRPPLSDLQTAPFMGKVRLGEETGMCKRVQIFRERMGATQLTTSTRCSYSSSVTRQTDFHSHYLRVKRTRGSLRSTRRRRTRRVHSGCLVVARDKARSLTEKTSACLAVQDIRHHCQAHAKPPPERTRHLRSTVRPPEVCVAVRHQHNIDSAGRIAGTSDQTQDRSPSGPLDSPRRLVEGHRTA